MSLAFCETDLLDRSAFCAQPIVGISRIVGIPPRVGVLGDVISGLAVAHYGVRGTWMATNSCVEAFSNFVV